MPKQELRPRDGADGWYWRDEAHREPDLVLFVHGYTGDPEATWERFPYLIREAGQGFERCEVASFGYQTGLIRNDRGLDTIAGSLLSFVDAFSEPQQNIFVVAHSLGGLVTRRFLVAIFENQNERRFFEQIRQVHFIGVPHLGAGMTGDWLEWVRRLNVLAAEVRADSPALQDTLYRWGQVVEQAKGMGMPLPSLHNYVGDRDWLAPMERVHGALTATEEYRVVPGGHVSISKPGGSTDILFTLVRERILEGIRDREGHADTGSGPASHMVGRASGAASTAGNLAVDPGGARAPAARPGIRARRLEADTVVDGVHLEGTDAGMAAALGSLAANVPRSGIEADEIQAGRVVVGLLHIANPHAPTLDEIRQAIEALRAELDRVIAAGGLADPKDAEDARAAIVQAATEASEPQPAGRRVLRGVKAFADIVAQGAAAGERASEVGAGLAGLARTAGQVYQVVQAYFGG